MRKFLTKSWLQLLSNNMNTMLWVEYELTILVF